MNFKIVIPAILIFIAFIVFWNLTGSYYDAEISNDKYYKVASLVKQHPSVKYKIKDPAHITNSEYFELIRFVDEINDKARLVKSKQILADTIDETK